MTGLQPLARFDVTPPSHRRSPLRYIDDRHRRLAVKRRAYSTCTSDLPLVGRAVRRIAPADRRSLSRRIHTVLNVAMRFYRDVDDNTITECPAVLNALKESIRAVRGSAINSAPFPQARVEMLVAQNLLQRNGSVSSGGPLMVAYPEPWMDRVDTLRRTMRWGDIDRRVRKSCGPGSGYCHSAMRPFGPAIPTVRMQVTGHWPCEIQSPSTFIPTAR
jgi:hypothetical protein